MSTVSSPAETLNDQNERRKEGTRSVKGMWHRTYDIPAKKEGIQQSETSWSALSQVIVCFFLAFNTWGIVNSFAVFETYYTKVSRLGRSNSDIAWIGTLQGCLLLATMVITGPLFDRGQSRLLFTIGLILVVLGIMMTSLGSQYWHFILSQGLCVGLGSGCLFIVAVGQIPLTFSRRRWMAMGVSQSGGSIGGIVYSIAFKQLQPRIGFPWAVRIMGFIMLGTLLLAMVLLRPYKLPVPRRMFELRAFKDPVFMIFAFCSLAGFAGLYIPFFYIVDYSLANFPEQKINVAYYTPAILNAGSVIGRIVPAFAADEFGLLNIYTICTTCASVMAFAWIGCTSLGGIVVFCLLYGVFCGFSAALQPAVLASLAPKPELIGTWVGMGELFGAAGLLIGSPLAGLIFRGNDWLGVQLFCAVLVGAAALTAGATRVVKAGSSIQKVV